MTERLLQFIWQFGHFNFHELRLETGETLQILSPGEFNTYQGPDFLWGSVRIDDTLWVGNIELHLSASDWQKHAHGSDKQYDNVILHVVWENDLPQGQDHLPGERNIPLLVLQPRVPKLFLGKYEEWMTNRSFIPCERQVKEIGASLWQEWKQDLLKIRLQRKTRLIAEYLQQNNHDWEETAWWLLARNFGYKVNTGIFEAVARSLPLRLLSRHRDRPDQLEALLFGQAGLLKQHFKAAYPQALQKEFQFLRNKYGLRPVHEPVHFLRMRPSNFPTIRLSQLAGVLQGAFPLMSRIREADSPAELEDLFSIAASEFWDRQYTLGESREQEGEGTLTQKKLGTDMKGSILINTLAPLLFAYGSLHQEEHCRDKAVQWLQDAHTENNSIIAGWAGLGVTTDNAADSQALLELKDRYCNVRKCLECSIGKSLLGRTINSP